MPDLIKDGAKTEYTVTLGDLDGRGADASIVVGGKTANFVPNVNASKWDDEVWLNINPKGVVVTSEKESFSDGEISIEVGDLAFKYYILENGRLEWETHFNVRPLTNKLEFDLDFSEGMRFLYQDTLENDFLAVMEKAQLLGKNPMETTLEDYLAVHTRPEDVIGSYVCVVEKTNNKYKTGQFCHIFRPKLTDADKKSIWAELNLDPENKKLIYNFDPTWMANAHYPVKLGGTILGYDADGGSGRTMFANFIYAFYVGTAVSGGAIDNLSYWHDSTNQCSMKLAIYDESGGNPNNRIDFTAEINPDPTANQRYIEPATQGGSVVDTTSYFVCCWSDASPQQGISAYATDAAYDNDYDGETYDGFPATFTDDGDLLNERHSSYVEYTEAAAGASIPIIMHHRRQLRR